MRCLLCALAVLAVAGCSDSSSPPRDTFEISGTLTDADGAPVVGAAVILDYEFRQLESDPPTKTAADLPEPIPMRFVITDACGVEVFYDSGDMTGYPGEPVFLWDLTDLEGLRATEGVYRYRIEADGREPVESDLALAWTMGNEYGPFGEDAAEIRATWRLDAMTDADGRFTLERNCWDFGHTDDWVDEEGNITGTLLIPHWARLWFYPEDALRGTPGPWVDIDPERGGVLDMVLPHPR